MGLLRHHVPTLCAVAAWAGRCALRLTDLALEAALAHIGEPMMWEDVEQIAQAKIEEERCEAAERWRALQEKGMPMLRLLSKP